jgi:hypothetical protein
MSLAPTWRVIWVWIGDDSPSGLRAYDFPYHLQDESIEETICGFYNGKPLQFAVVAYDPDRAGRCPECLFWYEQLVINYTMTKENQ